jgi:mercuric ion transport protein
MMRRATLGGAGGVVAAFLGSLCCVGPLLFVTLGVGAGLASALEPFRPAFGSVMVTCLAVAFWTVYGQRLRGGMPGSTGASAPSVAGASCTAPMRRRRDVVILWSATALAVVLWTFPTWSLWLL